MDYEVGQIVYSKSGHDKGGPETLRLVIFPIQFLPLQLRHL